MFGFLKNILPNTMYRDRTCRMDISQLSHTIDIVYIGSI